MACKTCDRMEELAQTSIEELIDEQLSFESKLADKEVIETRLAKCQVCPFLQEATCSKCGCFARFRASLPMKKCPIGYWEE